MADIPADAQRSEDGHYWWDAQSNEWKLIDDGAGGDANTADSGDSNASGITKVAQLGQLAALMDQAEQGVEDTA